MFMGARLLWHSEEEIREMMVRYYSEQKILPGEPDGNWRVIPEAARHELEKEAQSAAARPQLR